MQKEPGTEGRSRWKDKEEDLDGWVGVESI